jgi:siroheme synthase-like protein
LSGRRCLVIGDGNEAVQRCESLLASEAKVTLFATSPTADMLKLAGHAGLTLEVRAATPDDLKGAWLCVACGIDPALTALLSQRADEEQVLFCATDRPKQSNFYHLALAKKGSVTISIGTGGSAPALARRMRVELQRLLEDPSFAAFADELVALREQTPSTERASVLSKAAGRLRLVGELQIDDE